MKKEPTPEYQLPKCGKCNEYFTSFEAYNDHLGVCPPHNKLENSNAILLLKTIKDLLSILEKEIK